MIKRDRWQIVSDDRVWMFPADITVSTVELPKIKFGDGMDLYAEPYESCIFYANGDSDVVCRYLTKEDAIIGHEELEKKFRLKRCSELKI